MYLYGRLCGLAFVCMALIGCASSAKIGKVADKPVIRVQTNEDARPIQFRRIVVKLKRGTDIGSISRGLACIPREEFIYTGGRQSLGGDELTEVFQEELTAANYKVVGDPDALFDDPSAWKAEFLVAGLVKSMQANVCFPRLKSGDFVNGTAEASMTVGWQVYSRLNRKVVYEVSTQGYGNVPKSRPIPATEAFLQAFAQSTRNLIADQGFHDLVTSERLIQEAILPQNPLKLVRKDLSTRPLAEHINDVRLQVVTVFAGGGHGSGFFIDDQGHLLTNEHVVGSTKFVKVKLATGREVLGEVVATNPRSDVALLKTETVVLSGLPLRLSEPNIGSDVFAIGSPLDESLGTTVSKGIISAYRSENNVSLIQSDVTIHPGNSGGPLLDENGNAIGVAVKGIQIGGATAGLNFFVSIGDALKAVGIQVEPIS